ncbi:MAG: hypothetical protein VYA34_04895 [Myxococcota bacterium]|nr:hypothetical protein [Myxococcota bacterium]
MNHKSPLLQYLLIFVSSYSLGCSTEPNLLETCASPKGPHLIFDLSATKNQGSSDTAHWLRTPFPSDIRTHPKTGLLDWNALPNPWESSLFNMYLSLLAEEVKGSGLSTPVYFRFSAPIDVSGLPKTPSSGSETAHIQLIDITPNSPTYGKRSPIRWQYWENETDFVPQNTLAIAPAWGFPLLETTTYAVIITSALPLSNPDSEWSVEPNLFRLLSGVHQSDQLCSRPELSEKLDLQGMQTLADFLRLNTLDPKTIVAATAFTTQTITAELREIHKTIEASSHAESGEIVWTQLAEESYGLNKSYRWKGQEIAHFKVYEGKYKHPVYQKGRIPYRDFDTREGELVLPQDPATPPTEQDVLFTLTIPNAPPPAGRPCYTPIHYAHGTGGSHKSLLEKKAAKAGRLAGQGLVGFGISMPLHGDRKENQSFDESTMSFNFFNPHAGRANFRQGAADAFFVHKLLQTKLQNLPTTLDPSHQNLCLDPQRLGFFGHSQGGLTGALASASDTRVGAWVFSGAGGGLAQTLLKRKDIKIAGLDFEELIRFEIGMDSTGETLTDTHPIIAVIQSAVEITDPLNYASHWAKRPRPNHRLITSGCYDEQTPFETSIALALSGNVAPVYPLDIQRPEYLWKHFANQQAPISTDSSAGNTTGFILWCGNRLSYSGIDNHYVVFQRPEAIESVMRFLGSFAYEDSTLISRNSRSEYR